MFQEAAMVRARKEIEKMYDGTCTVEERVKYKKENGSTAYRSEIIIQDERCRVSFSSSPVTDTDNATEQRQNVKLFCSPDLHIKSGSRITVTQNERTVAYKSAGIAAVYATHQEINLENFEGWS